MNEDTSLDRKQNECSQAPLFRYLHMNDKADTELFTFILLPQLLCTAIREVISSPFLYANHFWRLHFLKDETFLGIALELETSELPTNSCKHALESQYPPHCFRSICLDFQFIMKSRQHYTQDVIYKRKDCLFNECKSKHGRKRFAELASLPTKRLVFDDGSSLIELEMKNPRVQLNLLTYSCPDPIKDSPALKGCVHESQRIRLMRLDGTVATFDGQMHFETQRFVFNDSWWYFTLDLEARSRDSPNHISHQSEDIQVSAEISLIKVVDTRQHRHKDHTQIDNHKVICSMTLPGECETGRMEFELGLQGWPLRAHQILFEEADWESASQVQQSAENMNQLLVDCKHSPTKLLLSTTKSPFSLVCRFYSSKIVTYKDVSFDVNMEPSSKERVLDPLLSSWIIRPKLTGRLLRFQFSHDNSYETNNSTDCNSGHDGSQSVRSVLGLILKILPQKSHSKEAISQTGKEILQLNEVSYTRQPNLYWTTVHPATSFEDWNKDNLPFETFEVAMDITVEKVYDKQYGILNPVNNKALVQIQWIYYHRLEIDRHPAEEIGQRHLVQMRNELELLQAERNEFERRQLANDLGLVEVDSDSHRPKSMIPKESALNLHDKSDEILHTRQTPNHREADISRTIISSNLNVGHSSDQNRMNENRPLNRRLHHRHSGMDQLHLSDRDSVKSDLICSRVPERRRRFNESKNTWRTCDVFSEYPDDIRHFSTRYRSSSNLQHSQDYHRFQSAWGSSPRPR